MRTQHRPLKNRNGTSEERTKHQRQIHSNPPKVLQTLANTLEKTKEAAPSGPRAVDLLAPHLSPPTPPWLPNLASDS